MLFRLDNAAVVFNVYAFSIGLQSTQCVWKPDHQKWQINRKYVQTIRADTPIDFYLFRIRYVNVLAVRTVRYFQYLIILHVG